MVTAMTAVLLMVLTGFMSELGRAAEHQVQDGMCEQEMAGAARRHKVPLAVLYAVGLNESGKQGRLHPYALNVGGAGHYPSSRHKASVMIREAMAQGEALIDVGCMQINHYWHHRQFKSLADMLDATKNVDYGARYLRQLYDSHGSWAKAVAIYHAGRANKPAQKRYLCSVIGKLVASGLGAWTSRARAFCSSADR
jgi:hypothetical protein